MIVISSKKGKAFLFYNGTGIVTWPSGIKTDAISYCVYLKCMMNVFMYVGQNKIFWGSNVRLLLYTGQFCVWEYGRNIYGVDDNIHHQLNMLPKMRASNRSPRR